MHKKRTEDTETEEDAETEYTEIVDTENRKRVIETKTQRQKVEIKKFRDQRYRDRRNKDQKTDIL